VAAAGVVTPQQVALPHNVFRELGAQMVMRSIAEKFGLPVIVKPAHGGSSLGVTKVDGVDDLPQAVANAYAYDDMVVVEEFIVGNGTRNRHDHDV
jgi:D-alanine-D-alanine ligase